MEKSCGCQLWFMQMELASDFWTQSCDRLERSDSVVSDLGNYCAQQIKIWKIYDKTYISEDILFLKINSSINFVYLVFEGHMCA